MEQGSIHSLTTAEPEPAVLTHVASHVRFWLPAALLLGLDLWSKEWVFTNLPTDKAYTVLPHVLELRRSLNDGAVFGSFTGYVSVFITASLFALAFVFYLFAKSTRWQRALHVALAMILAGAIGNLYDRAFIQADVVRYRDERKGWSVIGRALESSDENVIRLGDWPDGRSPRTFNVADVTLHQQGVVRDFVKFLPRFPRSWRWVGGYDLWPWVFNVADASLVCGVALLLMHCWVDRKPSEVPGPAEAVA